LNVAGGSEFDALATVGPTHVADADKIRGGQPVEDADLGAEQGGLATEALGPMPSLFEVSTIFSSS